MEAGTEEKESVYVWMATGKNESGQEFKVIIYVPSDAGMTALVTRDRDEAEMMREFAMAFINQPGIPIRLTARLIRFEQAEQVDKVDAGQHRNPSKLIVVGGSHAKN